MEDDVPQKILNTNHIALEESPRKTTAVTLIRIETDNDQ